MEKSILTKKEVCNYLNISIGTLDKLIRTGDIVYSKIGSNNSKVLFTKTDLALWLKSKQRLSVKKRI